MIRCGCEPGPDAGHPGAGKAVGCSNQADPGRERRFPEGLPRVDPFIYDECSSWSLPAARVKGGGRFVKRKRT